MTNIIANQVARIAVLLFLAASDMSAQDRSAPAQFGQDTSVVGIASSLRARGDVGAAVAVLTQLRGVERRSKLDALADTLVAVAISNSLPADKRIETQRECITSLWLAATRTTGVPYAGSQSRLLRIAENADDIGIRAGALMALTRLPNKAETLRQLRSVATSQNIAATSAVTLLAQQMGPEGLALLRTMYREKAVTEERAKQNIYAMAYALHWE